MTSSSLETLLYGLAGYSAGRRAGDGARPQRPSDSYEMQVAKFALTDLDVTVPVEETINELISLAEPGLAATTGPRFFGWVIGGCHPAGLAADWLTSVWHQNAGNHRGFPAASAAEDASAAALLELMDLPRDAALGFVTGATMANFTCLAAARGEMLRRVGWDVEGDGLFGAPPITVIMGEQAHTTVFAALKFLGFGDRRVVTVPADANGAMQADAATAAIRAAAGPAIVIAQAGHINSGAFDPFPAITAAARETGAWVHVDGAFGLWARATPALRPLTVAVEAADSWAVDGHKLLQTPYDCGYAIVRDKAAHRRAMIIAASYLPGADDGGRNPSDYAPELSRRARGFATWAIVRHLGRPGIAQMIERNCMLTKRMARRLEAEPDIAILNDVVLNQLAVRLGTDLAPDKADQLTKAAISRIQEAGVCFVGGAQWRGAWIIRISISGYATTEEDVEAAAAAIIAEWRTVKG